MSVTSERLRGCHPTGIVLRTAATLTDRECECLCLCAEGKSYWESGVILGITERTVSFHMEAVRSKLGAATNAHAVALAFRLGVLYWWRKEGNGFNV